MVVSVLNALKHGALRVLIVGGGNWGTCIASLAAENAARSQLFHKEVKMWIYDEQVEGEPIAQIINERKENIKYLPGVKLPDNLTATSDLASVSKEADLLVIVIPHQFVRGTIASLKEAGVKPSARAISLVKGLLVGSNNEPLRPTSIIERELSIPCAMLSGANVANDIAKRAFAETTLGYDENDLVAAEVWQQLFDRPTFKVNGVPDIAGVEVCGAVKNVVALGAGFCDGLGYGTNTKAAIIRVGVDEMRRFAIRFFDGILEDTFFDSAGYADVITTCFGGRNVRCAAEFVRRGGKDSWEKIEEDLLKGQKMQGHLTCSDVYTILTGAKILDQFPFFRTIWKISFGNLPPEQLLNFLAVEPPRHLKQRVQCVTCADID